MGTGGLEPQPFREEGWRSPFSASAPPFCKHGYLSRGSWGFLVSSPAAPHYDEDSPAQRQHVLLTGLIQHYFPGPRPAQASLAFVLPFAFHSVSTPSTPPTTGVHDPHLSIRPSDLPFPPFKGTGEGAAVWAVELLTASFNVNNRS